MGKFKFEEEDEEVDYNTYRKEGRKSRLNNKWRDKRKLNQDRQNSKEKDREFDDEED